MKTEVLSDPAAVARRAATFIAATAREAVAARNRFVMAVSGGQTPWLMLRELTREDVPWAQLQIVQVDERVALTGDPDRNLTHIHEALLAHTPLTAGQIHAMPVEDLDLNAAADKYRQQLGELAGTPPVLDLVHLGLGPDGHTASLVPGDEVLNVADRDVAVSGIYQGRKRLTLTYPILNRSRCILWVVTGESKLEMIPRLLAGDPTIPAGRITQDRALVLADQAAAGRQVAIT